MADTELKQKKKKQKRKYKKHLSIRLAVGMVLVLLLVQLVALGFNSGYILFSSMSEDLDQYAHVSYFIEHSVDSGILLDAVHQGEMTREFRVMMDSLLGGYDVYWEDIDEFLIFVSDKEHGCRAVIDLGNDDEEYFQFLDPLPGVTEESLKTCVNLAHEKGKRIEGGDVYPTIENEVQELADNVFGNTRPTQIAMFGYEDDPCGEQVYYLTMLDLVGSIEAPLHSIALVAQVTLVSTLILFLLLVLLSYRRVVSPLKKIRRSAVGFIDQTKTVENPEDWAYQPTKIRSRDEIQELSDTVENMAQEIRRSVEEILAATKESERVGVELQLAAGIQNSMLPRTFPAFPDRSDFDIYASMKPAREVGGDFYSYRLLDDDHLFLVIADVSGKGIPASLFMMASILVLDSFAREGFSPAEILSRANNRINEMNERNMFVTAWIGILDLTTGVIKAANAGHEYPAVYTPGQGFTLLYDKHGFVLGEFKDMKYTDYEITLEKGGGVFVYTDGVPEANNEKEEMFGTDRMVETLNIKPDADPKEIIERMTSSILDFTGETEQFDDTTMLYIKWKGPEEDS